MDANDIISELCDYLKNTKLPKNCDIGDIANEIGYVIGKHISDEEIQYFINGFKHGVSLAKGNHP